MIDFAPFPAPNATALYAPFSASNINYTGYGEFLDALAYSESSGRISVVNSFGYVGLYQIGEAALFDIGVYTEGANANYFNNDFKGHFTGAFGINSYDEFQYSSHLQTVAISEYNIQHESSIKSNGYGAKIGQIIGGVEISLAGMIAGAHLVGRSALFDFLDSNGTVVPSDGNGVPITHYLAEFQGYQFTGIPSLFAPLQAAHPAAKPEILWSAGWVYPEFDGLWHSPVPTPRPTRECFLPDTAIYQPDHNSKPIADIQTGDVVQSYDLDGTLVSGRVTRTMQNRVRYILDVHGLMVTPGHVTLCGDGRFAGQHVPMIDILRSDGALVKESGAMVRAGTNCRIGSKNDQMIQVIAGEYQSDGSFNITDQGQIRLGTRYITSDGFDISVRDLIRKAGGKVDHDGLIRTTKGGERVPFWWHFGPTLPKPEDYVLQRSKLTLNDIYQAGEWEAVRPRMPVPLMGEAAPVPERRPEVMYASSTDRPGVGGSLRSKSVN